MHDLPTFLNETSAATAGWLSELSWRTWLFIAILLIVGPHHLVRGIAGIIIIAGITAAVIHV